MAAPRHRTHVGALLDLAEACAYLRQEAPDQVPRFLALFRESRSSLRRRPLMHRPLYGDYRRTFIVPFRYMIVYATNGRDTDILAVLHAMRDPVELRASLQLRTFEPGISPEDGAR